MPNEVLLLYNSGCCQHVGLADNWYVSSVCRSEPYWTKTGRQKKKTVDQE